jgi:hypothetical protein
MFCRAFIALLAFCASLPAFAGAGLSARATVAVSDGLRYNVFTVYRDQQHAVFHREYPDRQITQMINGDALWQQEGADRVPGQARVRTFVLGHQFHALIIWPEENP